MSLTTRIKLVLSAWFVAEALVLVIVARIIGIPEALLLAFVTSLFGWTLLKRAGASAMVKLRAALEGRRVIEGDARPVLEDALATFAALALLVPGFLSDALGLLLMVPATRDRASRWIGSHRLWDVLRSGPAPSRGPSTIDLDPIDWKRAETEKSASKY